MDSKMIISALLLFVSSFSEGVTQQTQSSQEKVQLQGFLKIAEPKEKTLPSGGTHSWQIALESDRYISIEVLQKSVDVVIRIFNPESILKGEFDKAWISEIEQAAWATKTKGNWNIEIAPSDEDQSGDYQIKWLVYRDATETDWRVMEADSLTHQGDIYYNEAEYAKAEPLYLHALAILEVALGPDPSKCCSRYQ